MSTWTLCRDDNKANKRTLSNKMCVSLIYSSQASLTCCFSIEIHTSDHQSTKTMIILIFCNFNYKLRRDILNKIMMTLQVMSSLEEKRGRQCKQWKKMRLCVGGMTRKGKGSGLALREVN